MMIAIRNIIRMCVILGIIVTTLKYTLAPQGYLLNLAVVVLSLHLTDIFIKIVWNSLPSSLLPDLEDKAVFITGCDTGFGNITARDLDKTGVTVFAGCLFAEGPGAVQLKKDCSNKLHIIQLDVTKDEQVKSSVETVTKILNGKPLHAIINNAGILTAAEMEYLTVEEQKNQAEVNTFGVTRVTQAFLPLIRKSKGRIVIVASSLSYIFLVLFGGYSMSKAAVYSYAETLRRELMRWNISVHTVEPWHFRTPLANKDLILYKLNREYQQASEEVRDRLGGESYISRFKSLYDAFMATSSGSPSLVTDCMIDAAIGKHPELRYVPGIMARIVNWLAVSMPSELIDFLNHILLVIFLGKGTKKKNN